MSSNGPVAETLKLRTFSSASALVSLWRIERNAPLTVIAPRMTFASTSERGDMIPVASVYPAYVIGNGSRAARELSRTARLGMSLEIAGGGSGYRLQESLSPTAKRLSAGLFLLLAGLSGSRQRDLLRCSRLVVVDGQL